MSDEIGKINERLYDHGARISTNEANIKNVKLDVTSLKAQAMKAVWIVLSFVIVGILTFVFKGGSLQ